MAFIKDDYTVLYSLKDYEYKKLIELLSNDENRYNAFIIMFLKELNGDINKVLRIINVGVKSKVKIFNVSLPNYLLATIREAVILSNYKQYIDEEGFISIVKVSRTERFRVANIKRQTIIRTFRKYDIKYNLKR